MTEPQSTSSTGRRDRRWRRLAGRAGVLSAVTLICIAVGLFTRMQDPVALQQLRNIAFDQYQNWHPRDFDPDLPVRIVAIDEDSLGRIGQWPWPRARMAELSEKLVAMGAATVAFDFILSEPDRMSRSQIAGLVPEGAPRTALLEALSDLPDGDARLAAALAAGPTILGVVLGAGSDSDPPPPKAGFAFAGDSPHGFLAAYDTIQGPLPALADAAQGLAALNWVPSRDQVVRAVPLVFLLGDNAFVPSLAAEALRVAQGASTFVIRSSNASGQSAFGAATGINTMRIGAFDVATDPNGAILMHFTPQTTARQIPAWKVLDGSVDPAEIAGRIMLVGATAPGLFDLQATPIDVAVPGIDINAQVIEHILTGTGLKRPDWAAGLEMLTFAGLAIAFGIIAAFLSPAMTAGLGALAVLAVFGASYGAFVRQGLLLDPTFAAIGSAISLFAATSWIAIRESADRRWVRHAFGRYVSDDLVQELVRNPDRLTLGGELRPMTILFSDIRSFTTRAEGMDAQELTAYVNDFLTATTAVIAASGGTIDKYIGDAVMAFWNAPLDDADHAASACGAALRMLDAVETFNRENAGRYPATAIGIGVNTGICCVGNLGSRQRFDYSVIGDTVNIGSRLESNTKTYGVPILIGADTAEQAAAHGYVSARIDNERVKGRDEPIDICMLLGGPDHPVPPEVMRVLPKLEALADAHLAGDPARMRALLTDLRDCNLTRFDTLLAFYEARLAAPAEAQGTPAEPAPAPA